SYRRESKTADRASNRRGGAHVPENRAQDATDTARIWPSARGDREDAPGGRGAAKLGRGGQGAEGRRQSSPLCLAERGRAAGGFPRAARPGAARRHFL